MIWRMPDTGEKTLYLTFDDGPAPNVTDQVLDILQEYGAKATFFCIGQHALNHPTIIDRILAEGHELGNHTFDHLNGWRTPKPKYLSDVAQCDNVFKSTLFRPPYGKLRIGQYMEIRKTHKVIMWDVVSGDFDRKVSQEQCLKNVLDHADSGSIVLMHDKERTAGKLAYYLPRVLGHYAENGFVFKSLKL